MKTNAIQFVFFFLFFGVFAVGGVRAQTAEDSLLNIVNTATDDSIIVHGYINLCDLKTYNDTRKAIEYAEKAVELAEKAKYYLGIAKGYERLGNAYFQLGENRKAADNYLGAREANKNVDNYEIDASVLYNLGNIQHEMGDYDSAIYYAQEAGKVFISNNDTVGYGASLYLSGSEFKVKGNYEMATKNILEALEIFRKRNIRAWEIYSLNALIEVYNVQEKYDESLRLLNECLSYHKQSGNAKFTAITYRFMGDIYLTLENYDRARVVLDSSYFITNTRGFEQEKTKTMYSQGLLEFDTENYDNALTTFEAGLKQSLAMDDKLFICSNYLGIGKCLFEKGDHSGAVSNLNKSVEHAKIIEDNYKLRDGYFALSENYEAMNQPAKALENYKMYAQFKDSVVMQENKRQFAELASKYETEQKEQEISTLQLEKETVQSNKRRVTVLWILTSFIALLIVSILVLAYRKNKQLLATEKEMDQVKSRFFTNISHEFRTPLTLIIGPVNDLLQKKESQPFRRDLKLIKKQAKRLLTLINQILDLSKLDAGKYQLSISNAEFVAALKTTVMSFHSFAGQKNIRLTIKTDRDKLMINFDRENVETILNNLLSNAFKFEPEGGAIDVEMSSWDVEKKHQLQINVINRGTNIPPEMCDNLFDRFYQSEHEQKTGKGTGIGLALTKELVEVLGGSVRVKSSKEEGTCFAVILPTNKPVTTDEYAEDKKVLTKSPAVDDESYNAKSKNEATKSDKSLVLVIEDHSEVSNYIQSVLHENYNLVTAENGEEGINKAIELIPDVIISDVMMPEKDGIEVTHTLKNRELTSHIPIILLTAKASVESRLEGLGAKADAYLTKPFNANELKLHIKNMLETREKLREKYSGELVIKPQNLVVKSLDEVFMEKICRAIEDNMKNEHFSVEDLSKNIGLSRSQLHRKLEAITAKTASQFIREYRLERARELIEKNVGTIAEISYQVGFNSPGYFNKCFKEYFKITPGDLRNSPNLLMS